MQTLLTPVLDPGIILTIMPFPEQPDPGETAWTLGEGGTPLAPGLAAGADRRLVATLRNDGRAVAFDPDSSLLAVVWAGAGAPALLRPAATWLDPAGGVFALDFAANQTATLDEGEYRLRVSVALAGFTLTAYDGVLRVAAGPGLAVAPVPVWCSFRDMLQFQSGVSSLQAVRAADETGYLNIRQVVTGETLREIADRYAPMPGFTRRRQAAPHPVFGFDVPVAGTLAPAPGRIRGYLSNGGLILEPQIREAVARRAIADVLQRQATASGGNGYSVEAERQRAQANMMLMAYQPRIDVDGDGVADLLLVGPNVTLLPMGTEP